MGKKSRNAGIILKLNEGTKADSYAWRCGPVRCDSCWLCASRTGLESCRNNSWARARAFLEDRLARYDAKHKPAPAQAQADPPPFDPATATYPLMMMVLRSRDQSWIGPIMIVSYRKESIAPYTDLNHYIWREARPLTDAEIAALRDRP